MKESDEPAFPVMMSANESGRIEYHKRGITMRDYFAAKAMQGLMSATDQYGEWSHCVINAARIAYEVSDAMLEARKK